MKGNIHHWLSHHKFQNELVKRLEAMDSLSQKRIGRNVIDAAWETEASYLGPNRLRLTYHRIKDKDVKRLNYLDFAKIQKELIKMFLILLAIRNENLTRYCESAYCELFGEDLQITNYEPTKSEYLVIMNGMLEFVTATRFAVSYADLKLIQTFPSIVMGGVKATEKELGADEAQKRFISNSPPS